MGGHHQKAADAAGGDAEGDERGAIAADEVLPAGLQLPFLLLQKLPVALPLQAPGQVAAGVKGGGAGGQEGQQFFIESLFHFHPPRNFFYSITHISPGEQADSKISYFFFFFSPPRDAAIRDCKEGSSGV